MCNAPGGCKHITETGFIFVNGIKFVASRCINV